MTDLFEVVCIECGAVPDEEGTTTEQQALAQGWGQCEWGFLCPPDAVKAAAAEERDREEGVRTFVGQTNLRERLLLGALAPDMTEEERDEILLLAADET